MALSRKRQRELDRLKGAGRRSLGRPEGCSRAREPRDSRGEPSRAGRSGVAGRDVFDTRVRPAVSSGRRRPAASVCNDDVVPARLRRSRFGTRHSRGRPEPRRACRTRSRDLGRPVRGVAKTGLVKAKPSAGPGRYILIGVGIVAAAGIAYAAWQTLRADDDLWIDDEELTEGGEGQPS